MDIDSKEGIRHAWRTSWLHGLHDFTSLKNQEELWLAKRPGEMQTFVECMCCYLDDSFHGQSLEDLCGQGYLSEAEVEACRAFHNLAHAYNPPEGGSNGDDRAILADPKWHAVVTAAQEAWKRLRFIITSEEEQSVIKDCDRK
jgi:hypothetical protein